jgi:SAM-dependent methyltransferase
MTTAFDSVANTYDRDFSESEIARWLRERVWERLESHFQAGDTALEIGCGTGIDAVRMAECGVHVIATDISPAMLQQTQGRAENAHLTHLVSMQLLDLNSLPTENFAEKLNGVYSNFGPVNCTRDWAGLGKFLAKAVKAGGYVGLGVMSPFCLWETVWHGAHLNFGTAFRRLRRQTTAVLADGATLPIYYPSPKQLTQAFQPYFQPVGVRGLGVFLPPSDVFGVIEKRPKLMQSLIAAESRLAPHWPFRTWADHYWIEFIRSGIQVEEL